MLIQKRVIPLLFLAIAPLAAAETKPAAKAAAPLEITVYKTPTCGCCSKWEDHLRANGFQVKSEVMNDVTPVKDKNGIPKELRSCHTGIIDGLAIEGHVPAKDIKKFLAKRTRMAKGLAVPGMPMGSPGMEGATTDKYETLSFDRNGRAVVFEKH